MIGMLRMLLSALAAQLMGTIREVEANSTVAVVKVQSLIRVMDFVTSAIFTAKRVTRSQPVPWHNYGRFRSRPKWKR